MAETKTAAPSAATRAMLRALADRLTFTLPTAAELVSTHVREALDALIAGDFVRFCTAQYHASDALEQVHTAMMSADPTAQAIQSLDPSYWATVVAECMPRQVAFYRKRLEGLDPMTIATRYARHKIECREGRYCAELRSFVEELASRGIKVPE